MTKHDADYISRYLQKNKRKGETALQTFHRLVENPQKTIKELNWLAMKYMYYSSLLKKYLLPSDVTEVDIIFHSKIGE